MIEGANTTVTTYRLVDSSSTAAFSASATVTAVDAYIESISQELSAVIGEQPGIEKYAMYVEPCDIRVGDKVVDAQSNEYRVAGITRHENNLDTDDIYEVMLNKATKHYNE